MGKGKYEGGGLRDECNGGGYKVLSMMAWGWGKFFTT